MTDARKAAIERGRKVLEEIKTDRCWSTEEFLQQTGLNEDALMRYADYEGVYFYVEDGGQKWWPKFQLVTEGATFPPCNFDAVLALLRWKGHGGWDIYRFFISANPRWNDPSLTPMELLRAGRLGDALWDVRTYLEHGAT